MASAKTGEMCPESSLRLAEALVLSRVPIQREEALGLLPGVDRSLQKRICLFFFFFPLQSSKRKHQEYANVKRHDLYTSGSYGRDPGDTRLL